MQTIVFAPSPITISQKSVNDQRSTNSEYNQISFSWRPPFNIIQSSFKLNLAGCTRHAAQHVNENEIEPFACYLSAQTRVKHNNCSIQVRIYSISFVALRVINRFWYHKKLHQRNRWCRKQLKSILICVSVRVSSKCPFIN